MQLRNARNYFFRRLFNFFCQKKFNEGLELRSKPELDFKPNNLVGVAVIVDVDERDVDVHVGLADVVVVDSGLVVVIAHENVLVVAE